MQIVGIAKTGKYIWVAEPPLEFVYFPLTQRPQPRITLIANTIGESASVIAPIREMVRRIDPNQPIFGVRTMEDLYHMRAVSTPNIILDVVASLGFAGLVLAMVGLYGLVAYSVSRRTREFGIRLAIGAQGGNVIGMVMQQGIILALTGIVIGVALSIPAKSVLEASFVTGSPDLLAFALVPPMLFLITLLAAYAPALRASRIDPIRALRDE
jgi:predicted lysophospholipase L1 biosynthesis ABC-type transport system permease subunit